MQLLYFATCCLLILPGAATPGHAQALPAPADSSRARPRPWLVKGGLRLTHLTYSCTSTSWRALVPVSVGFERRVGARLSFYTQLDADMQLASVSARRRRRSALGADATFPEGALVLGVRYYHGRPAGAAHQPIAAPEFGKYLALEAGTSVASAATHLNSSSKGFVGTRSLLTPSLYVLWGIQNRLRRHLLYDLNAGPGLLAPVRTTAEYYLPSHRWDIGVQANVRLYWGN